MKENLGRNTTEEDSSDEDEDLEKSKKTKRFTRGIPFGVKIDTESEQTAVKKRSISISEQFFKQMDLKESQEKAETSDDKEKDQAERSREGTAASADIEKEERTAIEHPELSQQEGVVIKTDSENILEAANWEDEGDLDEDSEVRIATKPVASEKIAKEPLDEEFAEVPVAPDTERDSVPADVDTELLATGLGGGEPPRPPEDIPVHEESNDDGRDMRPSAPVFERPRLNPVLTDRERLDREAELNDAEYYAEKRGKRQGVAAGLLFGWLFGRRGKKKAEQAHAKELKLKNKEISELQSEQFAAEQRIKAIKRNQEVLESAIKKEATQTISKTEKFPQTFIAEKNINRPEADRRSNDKLPEHTEITEDTYKVPDGSRVETSAWHRIEIDQKTGKPVENPSVAYGEEYRRERRKEILPDDHKKGTVSVPIQLLGGIVSVPLSADRKSHGEETSDKTAQQSTMQESNRTAQSSLLGNETLRYVTNPLTWVIAAVVVVVLFLVGFLR